VRLLLDTHVWLWALMEPARLSRRASTLIQDDDNELWLSPVSAWEAHLLAERGQIVVDAPPGEWIERQLIQFPLRDALLTRSIAVASRRVRLPHEDPADRFIVATALVQGLQLLTADTRLLGAAACPVIAAGRRR
jgi:PIN domain nuclease of toxin-antitoxin system